MLLLPVACINQDCDLPTDDALSAQAEGMSLAQMYEFHVRTTKQCTPMNTSLSWDVAGFGEPAKKLAMQRTDTNDAREFYAALSVIGSFNMRHDAVCTPAEHKMLEARANRLSMISSLRDSIRIGCMPSEGGAILNGH